jgi:AcrR family transcriptional regulator
MEKDTRQIILDTAKKEFALHGLEGARIDLIAAHAKVNKAMIYYHFYSKEGLYQAVIDSHFSRVAEFLEESLAKYPDPETFLLKVSEFYNSMFQDEDFFLPIMLREIAGRGERIKNDMKSILSRRGRLGKLKKLIDDGIKGGSFRKIDTSNAIISFIGMNLFYLIMAPMINTVWEIKDEKKFRQKRAHEVVDLFLYGLKAR